MKAFAIKCWSAAKSKAVRRPGVRRWRVRRGLVRRLRVMADFAKHIEPLVTKEGGYKLHHVKGDRGGRTYAGISERSNPDWRGWALIDSGAPPPELHSAVHDRYRERYWTPIRGDDIKDDDVCEVMFSCAVLSGPRRAIKLAQQCVEERADGVIGPRTCGRSTAWTPSYSTPGSPLPASTVTGKSA